jgi:hypothetical protein
MARQQDRDKNCGAAKAASFNGSVSKMTAATSAAFANGSFAVLPDTLLTCSAAEVLL